MLAKNPGAPLVICLFASSFTTIASKLAPTRGLLATGFLPATHSSNFRTVRNMIYFVQSYAAHASQPSANKLSTSPPTAIGDNCGKTAKSLHKNQRKNVTYPEACFHWRTGHFLTRSLKVTDCKAFRGWQTPYPQKRQQTLGLTSQGLWKTAKTRRNSAFARRLTTPNGLLIIL
ncbi:hypothetical protein ABIE16_005137 [Pseudomonas sp. 2725]